MATPDRDPVSARVTELVAALANLQDAAGPRRPRPPAEEEATLQQLELFARTVTGRLGILAERWDRVRHPALAASGGGR